MATKDPSPPLEISTLPPSYYLREKQLLNGIVPFSKSTLWRKVDKGQFPAPARLSARVSAWRAGEVRAWLDAQHQEAA